MWGLLLSVCTYAARFLTATCPAVRCLALDQAVSQITTGQHAGSCRLKLHDADA